MNTEIETKLEHDIPLTPAEISTLTPEELTEELGYSFALSAAEQAALNQAALEQSQE